ncbi:AAA family ATPase [Larkinella sp. GY13]|uniref:AAA family ATPase n=1 Tax=Larkinella sp. GY13 TaxID=3453720 RepID=UPI003EE9FF9C
MKIKRLVIENFKSIERIELIEPNPFTVFVGPNGSGKSNIFEALEYVNLSSKSLSNEVDELFGGDNVFLNRNLRKDKRQIEFTCQFESFESIFRKTYNKETTSFISNEGFSKLVIPTEKVFSVNNTREKDILIRSKNFHYQSEYNNNSLNREEIVTFDYIQFFDKFSRVFISNSRYEKQIRDSSLRLSLSANNLEKVLRRLLNDPIINEEFQNWLSLFIPSFAKVEVHTDELTGSDNLLFYEGSSTKPFTKSLISDGTYNILCLLTAIYQSYEPQFLCIEEPENGLHPQVLMTLVDLIRQQCKEKGHYIWLNTHSESLVRMLTAKEIILVDKRGGATQIKQVDDRNLYDIPTDEAWLTGALGGGLPW